MWQHNVDLLAYHDLDGQSGFKLALQEVDGRFSSTSPDPASPKTAGSWWHPGQHKAAGEAYTLEDYGGSLTGLRRQRLP
jgi:hypothetical protein